MSSVVIMHIGSIEVKEGESVLSGIRKNIGLSQEGLARRFGVSVRTVVRWERGESPISLTFPQFKFLMSELAAKGVDINELPDDWGPLNQQN
jgi:transcriptional regulator with XRE-family HTH domain